MKPHEETWVAFDDGEIGVKHAGRSGALALLEWPEQADEDREAKWARARLAAQAPAMARLLLKGMRPPRGDEWGCLGCGTWEEGAHVEGCELIKVLKDAGVLP